MKIRIDALDTLFFKDGKPFSMGDESWADGIFQPPPSVIYGALRSAYFGEHPGEIEKAGMGKDKDPTFYLKIEKINYRINHKGKRDNYFPLPLDLVAFKNKEELEKNREKREKDYKVYLIENAKKDFVSSTKLLNISTYGEEIEGIEDGLISEVNLSIYLTTGKLPKPKDSNEVPHIKCLSISDYVLREPKVGIGRDNSTRTTSDNSKLYRVGMVRANDFGFIVEVADKPEVKKEEASENEYKLDSFSKFIKFGAEGKVSSINNDTFTGSGFKIDNKDIKKFKLYLSTPTFFKHGWLPEWMNEDSLEGHINNTKVKLTSAFIGKPLSIGGFDMKKKCPKPMRKAVPAGSVYYFEITEGNMNDILNEFHEKSISEFDSQKEGFGIAYVGVIN